MFVASFHSFVLSFKRCITYKANALPPCSVCDLPVIYLVHSYNPAYPNDIVEYPSYSNLSIVSPFFNLANAPYCHKIGATSEGVPFNLSCLHIKALKHNSKRSSKIL